MWKSKGALGTVLNLDMLTMLQKRWFLRPSPIQKTYINLQDLRLSKNSILWRFMSNEKGFTAVNLSRNSFPNNISESERQSEKLRASIACPTSGVAQRPRREAAPHARGVSKARQL
jgi:hypothetical protein